MSQDPEPLVLWKHEPKPKNEPRSKNTRSLKTWARIQNLWSSESMSQSPKTLGPLKTLAKPQNPRPLKTWARIQNLCSSENISQSPKILGLLKTWARIRRPPSKHILYSFKKKNLQAWTTFGPDPPTKRYVGNLPRDSVHIFIHYMIICIFI